MIMFFRCITENCVLEAQSKTLADNCTKLEIEKSALEERDGDYWNQHTVINKSELDAKDKKVSTDLWLWFLLPLKRIKNEELAQMSYCK